MANIKSQIKRIRQNEVRRERNKAVRSELRTRTKNALVALEEGAEDAAESVRNAARRIDKAAAKGVIHPNQAARRKSRLMRHANAAGAPEAAVEEPKAPEAAVKAPSRARAGAKAAGAKAPATEQPS